MSAVAHLASLLARSQAAVDPAGMDPAPATEGLDALIARLASKVSAGSSAREPVDLQREVVQRFWDTRRLETLRDARLVAFGLGLPAGPGGISVLEDPGRLDAFLQAADGWLANPRWFRRCYQGLVWSYFNAAREDGRAENANWLRLRDYLLRRVDATRDRQSNPDWVNTLDAHRSLFGESPCQDFVAPLLRGERQGLDALCAQLGIAESSWFLRELLQAQVIAATRLGDPEFIESLPAMLAMLAGGSAWRDAGMTLLLERYAQMPQPDLHAGLRDAVVQAWGCPWKPVDALRWDGIGEPARKLAGDWLRAHLLDRFFAPMGQSGARRAAFWKRYVQSILALGWAVPDPANAHEAARGVVTPICDGAAGDAAIVLTIGCARLVAFADPDEGVWAYDLRRTAPCDMDRPVAIGLDMPNSLRRADRDLLLVHEDGLGGWRQWEQSFEAALKDRFGIRVGAPVATDGSEFVDLSDGTRGMIPEPSDASGGIPGGAWHAASNGEDVHWQTAEAMSVPYSRTDLQVLARVHVLTLKEGVAGKDRVRVAPRGVDDRIARVLGRWGFTQAEDGDWCR